MENSQLKQLALLDLSILNFGIMRGKGGGPSCNQPANHPQLLT
jgi:hypothetical protein